MWLDNDPVAQLLDEAVDVIRSLRWRNGHAPEGGSRAHLAWARLITEEFEPSFLAYRAAIAQLSAAEDTMLALSMLLSWRSSSVAPATLVRSAVEASGRAFVFMDPGLSDAERGVLALAERMHEHQQFKKLVQSNPLFEARDEQALADLRDANGRISAIRRAAKDRGWVVPQRSSFTSVVRAVLEGADKGSFGRVSVMYSSIAHAVPHLLVVNSWMLDGKTDDEWGVGWQELDDEVVLEFTLVTLSAYARAVHRQIEAFGWPPSAWERWLGHARAVLRRSLPASH